MRTLLMMAALLMPLATSWVAQPTPLVRCMPCASPSLRHSIFMKQPRIERPIKNEENNEPGDATSERDSLYATPDFELDAFTITALLGVAIAFQFFVLGNM